MIRLAKKRDIESILSLYNSSCNLNLNGRKEDYDIQDINGYLKNKSVKIFVYEEDEQIRGGIQLIIFKTYVYLDIIVVDEKYQEKGIGKKLLEFTEKFAKDEGIGCIESFTEMENGKMQHVFNKLDYKKGNTFCTFTKELK